MPIDKVSGIFGVGGVRKENNKKKVATKSKVEFASSVSDEDLSGTDSPLSVGGGASPGHASGGVENLNALLAVQEITQKEQVSGKKIDWGKLVLNDLENIRIKLLDGRVPKQYLKELLRDIENKNREIADEKLEGIINEIEIRARVEMAKLGFNDRE